MQNSVFVLDTNKQPLSPCRPSIARKLLRDGKAAVYRRYPFTLILKRAVELKEPVPPITVKVDPGSKTTGIALVSDASLRKNQGGTVIFAAELAHRGQQIKGNLDKRRAARRGRRNRKTRYRQPRFNNRTRKEGWLAPSLRSRVDNIQTWLVRFIKLCNVQAISMELVRFDTQLMQNVEISGVEYQQGELQGYEVREYLLEKFDRKCCYCGKTDCCLEVEHIRSKDNGGSNRVSNLCIACHECNQRKGSLNADEFGYPEVQALAKKPLKDASAVNSTRWAIWRMFDATGLPVEVGTGGRTKFNRTKQDYPKAHWIDAACVGAAGQTVKLCPMLKPLQVKAVGRGSRQMVNSDKYGFPRGKAKQAKRVHGFQTGDMVKATISEGKKKGQYVGTVSIRTTGSFKVNGKVDGVRWNYCKRLHAQDGYAYTY